MSLLPSTGPYKAVGRVLAARVGDEAKFRGTDKHSEHGNYFGASQVTPDPPDKSWIQRRNRIHLTI